MKVELRIPSGSYWASVASPTLGCSIEISRVIYIYMYVCMYVCMSSIVYGKTIQPYPLTTMCSYSEQAEDTVQVLETKKNRMLKCVGRIT